MYAIQNRQKRTWTIPPLWTPDLSKEQFASVTIFPGDTVLVEEEHWDKVKQGNQVIEALLTGRFIVVTSPGKVVDVEVDELKNHASPVAPSELSEKDDRLQIDFKSEIKEVELKPEGPREGRSRK